MTWSGNWSRRPNGSGRTCRTPSGSIVPLAWPRRSSARSPHPRAVRTTFAEIQQVRPHHGLARASVRVDRGPPHGRAPRVQDGPFKWFVSVVELMPRRGGGTTLTHHIRVEPRGLLGRHRRRRRDRLPGRASPSIASTAASMPPLSGKLGPEAWVDAFANPTAAPRRRRRKLDALVAKLVERGVDDDVADRLGEYLANCAAGNRPHSPPGSGAAAVAAGRRRRHACLHGARDGLLVLLWDILCPICRIPSQVQQSLRELRSHGRCEACNLDFDLDFANSVEVIFRAHPEVRDTELGVVLHRRAGTLAARRGAGTRAARRTDRVRPCSRRRRLPPRGPQLPYTLDFRVEANAVARRWDLSLSRGDRDGAAQLARRFSAPCPDQRL